MTLLVVIPCLNEAANLDRLLGQFLLKSTVDRLVVADGGSTDGSRDIIRKWEAKDSRVTLLDNLDRIQSAGINQAVEDFGSSHKWLLRVDAHCLYPDNYAETLLSTAQVKDVSSVVVPMITEGRQGFQLAVAAAQNSILGTGGSAHRHMGQGKFVEHGHHALMKLDLFRAVGGYCEAMPCNEDAELDYRIQLAGGNIWLEPEAAITYFPRTTISALWRQYFRYGIGRARNIRRHKLRPRIRQLIPLLVPMAIMILPLSLIHWIFAVPTLLWLASSLSLGALIGLKNGAPWTLLTGLAAAVMHMAWGFGFIWECLSNPKGIPPHYRLLQST